MAPNDAVLAPFRKQGHDHGKCVRDALIAAEQVCAREGASLTPLRRRVLELVWGAHAPVRAYDLLDTLRGERRRAAPPTIYRALDFLLSVRLIHRIESLNAFVGCADPKHSHGGQFLICDGCGAVAELDDPTIARRVSDRARALGFTPRRQTIEISGRCPDCAANG
jgi:Fur family zinc uptake transcriptional regulator